MSKIKIDNVDKYLAVEALANMLSTFGIDSTPIDEAINYVSDEYVCENCEYLKDDCVCEDDSFHGRYYREYDDE